MLFTTDGTMPAVIEQHLGEISTNGNVVGIELIRPADTSAYAINDSISNSTSAPTILTFTNVGRYVGRSGYIVKIRALTDQKACVAQLRLHLFHTAPTAINDNAAYALLYANKDKAIGYIDLDVLSTEDATASDCAFALWKGQLFYTLDANDRNIYAALETKTAFTPASAQKFYIELTADNN